MSILGRCPACEAKFKVDAQYAGRKAMCPRCGQVISIPSAYELDAASGSAANARPAPRKPPLAAKPPVPGKPPVSARPPVAVEPSDSVQPPAPAAPGAPLPARKPNIAAKPPVTQPPALAPATPASAVQVMPESSAASELPATAPVGRPAHMRRGGKPRKQATSARLALVIGGIAAVAILALAGGVSGVVWLLRDDGGGLPVAPSASEAKLVLEWPAVERLDALVHIDGRKRELAPSGEAAFALPPGEHRLRLQRRGFAPVEVSLSLQPGEMRRFAPEWTRPGEAAPGATSLVSGVAEPVPPGFEGWTQRYDAALSQAAREKKDVLVALIGSDWNSDTRALAAAVFPDRRLHQRADESLVLVVIDLPQSQHAYEQLLDSAQNSMLFEEYGVSVEEVPTLVMLDPEGKPYAVEHNYEASSVEKLLADIDQWQAARDERDRLFTTIEGLVGEERAKAAVAAVDWIRDQGLTRFYGGQFRQWEQVARQVDATNAAGYYEAIFEANWLVRWYVAGRNEDVALIERIVTEFDDWRQRFTFHDANRAARMHLVAAASLLKLGRQDDALRHIQDGLKHRPSDQQLLVQLQTLSQVFSGELSSGTGFVVAPGYVLTNRHVIEGPGRVVVLSSGSEEEIAAEVVAVDEKNDIALLQVNGGLAALPPLPLSDATVGRGARVAAFGYPLGDVLGRGLKLTTGVVSALPDGNGENMYLLDCRVNPGNSGGPLCDQRGQVIGMVTAKSGSSASVDSYGMALPAGLLQEFLQRSLADGGPPAAASPADPQEWDQVDAAVSASVLMVLKKK